MPLEAGPRETAQRHLGHHHKHRVPHRRIFASGAEVHGLYRDPEVDAQNEYTEGVKSAPLVIGKNWAEGGEEPYAQAKEQFQFRVSGTEFTGQTKMVQVEGKWYQAEWQNYTYDMKRTSIIAGGNDMGGLGSMPVYRNWEPVSYGQIMGYSAAHPDGPLFLPDTCGNQIKLVNAAPVDIKMVNGQFTNAPIPQHGIPEMRSGR